MTSNRTTRPRSRATRPSTTDPAERISHPGGLSSPDRTAAVTRVRSLEHELFDEGREGGRLNRDAAQTVVDELNELRHTLGWLEVDLDGRWRWPY